MIPGPEGSPAFAVRYFRHVPLRFLHELLEAYVYEIVIDGSGEPVALLVPRAT
jgi:hypothetical protein